jgi:hypothetical protein
VATPESASRYEARRIYGPQSGTDGVYDTQTHTWLHPNGKADMTRAEAERLAAERNGGADGAEGEGTR